MSMRNYGRVTPLQMDILRLGGEPRLRSGTRFPTDADRLNSMRKARESLKLRTGVDFGCDLAAWHDFLFNSSKFSEEYICDYAWKAVKQRIDELLNDPDRQRLAGMAEKSLPAQE